MSKYNFFAKSIISTLNSVKVTNNPHMLINVIRYAEFILKDSTTSKEEKQLIIDGLSHVHDIFKEIKENIEYIKLNYIPTTSTLIVSRNAKFKISFTSGIVTGLDESEEKPSFSSQHLYYVINAPAISLQNERDVKITTGDLVLLSHPPIGLIIDDYQDNGEIKTINVSTANLHSVTMVKKGYDAYFNKYLEKMNNNNAI